MPDIDTQAVHAVCKSLTPTGFDMVQRATEEAYTALADTITVSPIAVLALLDDYSRLARHTITVIDAVRAFFEAYDKECELFEAGRHTIRDDAELTLAYEESIVVRQRYESALRAAIQRAVQP